MVFHQQLPCLLFSYCSHPQSRRAIRNIIDRAAHFGTVAPRLLSMRQRLIARAAASLARRAIVGLLGR